MSIDESAKRNIRNNNASGSVGISGTRIRKMFDGRCVNTMVLIKPMRRASRGAASCENALSTPVQKKMVPAVTIESPKPRAQMTS